ncbi:MAG: glycoside hydrolase family 9 protein [Muribaculaceae bacterium]|nr:glycoside hydrolase family 9 protein [Muribaculaceae bacterium]
MRKLTTLLACLSIMFSANSENWIRVNQIGYLENDSKVAVMIMQDAETIKSFTITNTATGKKQKITKVKNVGAQDPFAATARLDFSEITAAGKYFITVGKTKSQEFVINNNAYAGTQEIPLKYMRQQRCGYNPFLKKKCHQNDGIIILHPTRDGEKIDVTGGWHDASDYLQYVTTSANATYQMLFAYQANPDVYEDHYDAAGNEGANGIADILDETKWGLDWLLKMNPDKETYFNQIADDRDHRLAVLPINDTVDYGWGEGKDRPVYPCCGEPYGLYENKNDSKGLASTLGKYASTFTLGAKLFKNIDSEYAQKLEQKALDAYAKGAANPGACQTAPCTSPYYYEEDNWTDDMQLAAAELFNTTGDKKYLKDAIDYGRQEPVTPWMGADSAHHYQWYPFVNLGHYLLAMQKEEKLKQEFIRNMRSGLSRIAERAEGDAFMNGIPFIWCSNNLTVAFVTQAMLYREITGDNQFKEIETAMRDWLFGVNPWGKCMIIGLPKDGDCPTDPHSAFTNLNHYPIDGGIVDGPVYTNIFNSLRGVHLRNVDRYAPFQSKKVVYHDDYQDYSTNEPTMDGTASTSYMLSKLASAGRK